MPPPIKNYNNFRAPKSPKALKIAQDLLKSLGEPRYNQKPTKAYNVKNDLAC